MTLTSTQCVNPGAGKAYIHGSPNSLQSTTPNTIMSPHDTILIDESRATISNVDDIADNSPALEPTELETNTTMTVLETGMSSQSNEDLK